MKQLILGTAGHIDHGKTALVKALTGTDCDRLPEEKRRGITIELGFAQLELPGGISCGVVDVPGHERFVRTMAAGASGIDLVLLVVAADEGVMPQTREHLEICRLLGVQSGLVVLTKCDLVAADWLELLQEELREWLAGTFLAEAPMLPVSSRTGAGLEELRRELARLAAACPAKRNEGPFRLPIDRVFTVAGFGTVATGTLLSGALRVGDEVTILPRGLTSRVRGLQAHGGRTEEGRAGTRLAVNLAGVEVSEVRRGDTLAQPGVFAATRAVDVQLGLLPAASRPLPRRSRLRLLAATYEEPVEAVLLDRDELVPGETAFAQLRFGRPVLLLPGDRFVLRRSSPLMTVGGGQVLDPDPPRRRRRSDEALALLTALAAGDAERSLALLVVSGLYSGASFAALQSRTGWSVRRLETLLAPLLASGELVQLTREPRLYLARASYEALQAHLLTALASYLRQHPLQQGIGREELKNRLPLRSDSRFFPALLAALEKAGKVVAERDIVRPTAVDASSSGGCLTGMLNRLTAGGAEPPTVKELAVALGIAEKAALEQLQMLVRQGGAVRIRSDLYYGAAPLAAIRELLHDFLRQHGEIDPGQFRELTGLSRKFMIPLLEYFDQEKLTIRVGDKRRLRRG